MSIIIFILILSFLVIIHELGHYFVAKWRKVRVEEFGLGYPPRFKKIFSHGETDFTLNLIPFGGFVRLEGEDGEEENTDSKKESSLSKNAFYTKSASSRLAIILAGPFVNFVFGVVAFSIIFSNIGIPTSLSDSANGEARISHVVDGSPAFQSGLKPDVTILGFEENGELIPTKKITEIQEYTLKHRGEEITIVSTGECKAEMCQEILNKYTVYVRTPEETPEGQGAMGVIFSDVYFKFFPWYEMPFRGSIYGIKQAISMGMMMIQALGIVVNDLVSGVGVSGSVAGPIGIVHHAQKSNLAAEGWISILSFAAMLSINLAIMNLLPIPALDGGRSLFIILESIFGKKKIGIVERYANYGGFIFILGLIIVITANDVWNIISGGI